MGEDRQAANLGQRALAVDRNGVWAATARPDLVTTNGALNPATTNGSGSTRARRRSGSVSGRHLHDPSDPNHAYITYSGYNHVTPATPGHIFEVRYNRATGTATFSRLDDSLGDLPISTIERDERKGVLYAGSDFGLVKRVNGNTGWTLANPGLPTNVPYLRSTRRTASLLTSTASALDT